MFWLSSSYSLAYMIFAYELLGRYGFLEAQKITLHNRIPAIKMRIFSTIIALNLVKCPSSNGVSILLIGDSIDRYINIDWCSAMALRSENGKVWEKEWADGSIKYGGDKGRKMPAYICGISSTNDTMAFVHTFGSSPTGPYYRGWINTPSDIYVDTKPRIQYAMELYYRSYAAPDRIIYHSAVWDMYYGKLLNASLLFEPFSSEWNESISLFEFNMNERLNDIIFLSKNLSRGIIQTSVGLRTAAFIPRDNHSKMKELLLHTLNRIIRQTAHRRNLTLYDLDSDVWSTVGWDYYRVKEVLRDAVHPHTFHCASAGEKLLSRQYSPYFQYRGIGTQSIPAIWFGKGLQPERKMRVILIRENNASNTIKAETYFILKTRTGELRRHGNVTPLFLRTNHIGEGDIYSANKEELDFICLGPPVPYPISRGEGVINTTIGQLYLINAGTCRKLHDDPEVFNVFGITSSNITSQVDEEWMTMFLIKSPILNIYRNNTLVRPYNSKEISVIINCKRHIVMNSRSFFIFGWKLHDVVIVKELSDLSRLPIGSPISAN